MKPRVRTLSAYGTAAQLHPSELLVPFRSPLLSRLRMRSLQAVPACPAAIHSIVWLHGVVNRRPWSREHAYWRPRNSIHVRNRILSARMPSKRIQAPSFADEAGQRQVEHRSMRSARCNAGRCVHARTRIGHVCSIASVRAKCAGNPNKPLEFNAGGFRCIGARK